MEGREGGKEGGLMSGHPAARAGLQPPKLRSGRLRHDKRVKGDGSVRSDKERGGEGGGGYCGTDVDAGVGLGGLEVEAVAVEGGVDLGEVGVVRVR